MRKNIFAIALIAVGFVVAGFFAVSFTGRTNVQPQPMPAYIGTASMELDETIVLQLRTTAPLHGEAILVYPKGDIHYQQVLSHVKAGLKPGEQLVPGGKAQLVKPWPVNQSSTALDTSRLRIKARPSSLLPASGTTQVEQAGQVSQQFSDTVQAVVNGMPSKVRTLVKDSGIRIVAAEAITDAIPELAGQQPRGWPPGSTWDNVDGVFYGGTVMVVSEYVQRNGVRSPTRDGEGVTRHEFGHAVDAALGSFSHSQAYVTAYETDASQVPAAAQGTLEYFLQPGDAGREETFAEVFAATHGGNSRTRLVGYIPQYFPETKTAVQNKLDNLP